MSEPSGNRTKRSIRNIEPTEQDDKLEVEGDLEIYAREVLNTLIKDGLPPTPNNFSLYFDRLLEGKSQNIHKQINAVLELEENNEDENSILLEQNLKQGFSSVKNILGVTANLYKNLVLMTKIIDKRKGEFQESPNVQNKFEVAKLLETDILKLNTILKSQSSSMKNMYEETAAIVKNVENETIFDNQYGVYNKRYLLSKLQQETTLIEKFKHKSSLIMIELSRDLKDSIKNEKAVILMTKTIARLLLKTSRRSDIVAHYGAGVFAMLLKHTDIESAKKASERLGDLVSNSTFFLADREIHLDISIGITDIAANYISQEIIVSALDAMEGAYASADSNYAVITREAPPQIQG